MIRAVLFDVDGTLYHQPPLRLLMACELGTVPWFQRLPWQVPRIWMMLSAFRRVREELRALGRGDQPLQRLQFDRAAERAAVSVDEMEATVTEWIDYRPLKYLPRVARAGLGDLLESLAASGRLVGAFSDYPVADKLDALGLRRQMTVELDATIPEINAFKPHPRGLALACERWHLSPAEVLYVGDRADVDAESAFRAGMPCVVVSTGPAPREARPHQRLRDIRDLAAIIERLDDAHP
jgi:FMN phosphatase YigB (HAD superfamily)